MKRRAIRTLALLLLLVPLLPGVTPLQAAQTVQIEADAGVTEVEVDNQAVRIEASAPVVVTLSMDGDVVEGIIRTAPGTRSATVKVTLVGPPERIIFEGRITGEQIFREYLPHQETGQGEM